MKAWIAAADTATVATNLRHIISTHEHHFRVWCHDDRARAGGTEEALRQLQDELLAERALSARASHAAAAMEESLGAVKEELRLAGVRCKDLEAKAETVRRENDALLSRCRELEAAAIKIKSASGQVKEALSREKEVLSKDKDALSSRCRELEAAAIKTKAALDEAIAGRSAALIQRDAANKAVATLKSAEGERTEEAGVVRQKAEDAAAAAAAARTELSRLQVRD